MGGPFLSLFSHLTLGASFSRARKLAETAQEGKCHRNLGTELGDRKRPDARLPRAALAKGTIKSKLGLSHFLLSVVPPAASGSGEGPSFLRRLGALRFS